MFPGKPAQPVRQLKGSRRIQRMDVKSMDRRHFIKVTGIAGILAARQAPAFAQGSTLHWVRWVDFIPESDVELKRQMPEAEKALGAKIQFETINANDLQPRITAAVQSGSGADIFNFQLYWKLKMSAPEPDWTAAVMRGCRSLALIVSNWIFAPSAFSASGIWRLSSTSDSGMKSTQRTQCRVLPCANAGACRAARIPAMPVILRKYRRSIDFTSIRESSLMTLSTGADVALVSVDERGLNLRET